MRGIDAVISGADELCVLAKHVGALGDDAALRLQSLVIGIVIVDQPPVEPRIAAVDREALVDDRGPIEGVGDLRIEAGLAEVRSEA